MLFDIPVNIKVIADNELEAEKYVKEVMQEINATENKVEGWDFFDFIPSTGYRNNYD